MTDHTATKPRMGPLTLRGKLQLPVYVSPSVSFPTSSQKRVEGSLDQLLRSTEGITSPGPPCPDPRFLWQPSPSGSPATCGHALRAPEPGLLTWRGSGAPIGNMVVHVQPMMTGLPRVQQENNRAPMSASWPRRHILQERPGAGSVQRASMHGFQPGCHTVNHR